jgi:hypothetical protein
MSDSNPEGTTSANSPATGYFPPTEPKPECPTNGLSNNVHVRWGDVEHDHAALVKAGIEARKKQAELDAASHQVGVRKEQMKTNQERAR